ncbi:MAG: hypothetical protein WA117_02600 [Verrucomicrobiia bacterium]
MTDIERLERFIRQRKKWKYWATPRETTDLQALRRIEHAMWEAVILVFLGLCCIMDSRNLFEPFHLIMWASILGFIVYLWIEASRISKLREIFERTAVQNASDLIDELKRRDAASASQDTLPSAAARGMRKGENTTDIERLEKYVRWRKKWPDWAPGHEGTDMQVLRKEENSTWKGMILFGYFLFRIMDIRILPEPFLLFATASILGFIVYLGMDVCRTARLREIFERTAVQKAEDVINELRRRDAASAPQDQPAS